MSSRRSVGRLILILVTKRTFYVVITGSVDQFPFACQDQLRFPFLADFANPNFLIGFVWCLVVEFVHYIAFAGSTCSIRRFSGTASRASSTNFEWWVKNITWVLLDNSPRISRIALER